MSLKTQPFVLAGVPHLHCYTVSEILKKQFNHAQEYAKAKQNFLIISISAYKNVSEF